MSQPTASPAPTYRSKTLAAWLALLLGAAGAHRLYLHGARDRLAWAYLPPTLVGFYGFLRLRLLGPEDGWGALLVPLLGATVTLGMLAAIVIALTPDEKWDATRNPGLPGRSTAWGAVLAAIAGLFLGATVLLSLIAFAGQRFFEWQVEQQAASPAEPARTGSR